MKATISRAAPLLCAGLFLAAAPAKATHPHPTVDHLIEVATAGNVELTALTNSIAQAQHAHGCVAKIGPIKKKERILEKAHNDYHDDFTQVLDICRSTVVCAKNAGVVAAAAAFPAVNGHFPAPHAAVVVKRKKDRWTAPTDVHYRDYLFNLTMTNGAHCEIQVNSKSMMDAKAGEGHKLYETMRVIGAKPEKEASPEVMEAFWQAIFDSQGLYDRAYAAGEH